MLPAQRPERGSVVEAPRENVFTIDELSAYRKISTSTLYKLVREGKIPSQKVGRHWRFSKAAIDRWLGDRPLAHEGQ